MQNKTFCALAWSGITTNPDGTLRPCCISTEKIKKDDGTYFNLGHDSLCDIQKSNYYKNLRSSMENGNPVQGCETCYRNESLGASSLRIRSNIEFKDLSKIQYLDLRLGNTCNLKCRMCNPHNSSLISEEYFQNKEILNQYFSIENQVTDDWTTTKIFETTLDLVLPNVTKLYMTGGEPTVIKKNYNVLQKLIDIGQAKNMSVVINTNMTNTNPKFYELLKNFKQVLVQMSIDGINQIANYIRYPTNFNQVDKCLTELMDAGENLKLVATPAVQILNLNKLDELFDYFLSVNKKYNSQKISVAPIILENPSYLKLSHLPVEYKIKCFERLNSWRSKTNKAHQPVVPNNFYNALKKLCYDEPMSTNKLHQFIEYNNQLDKIRNVKLQDYNEELYSVLVNV